MVKPENQTKKIIVIKKIDVYVTASTLNEREEEKKEAVSNWEQETSPPKTFPLSPAPCSRSLLQRTDVLLTP